MWLTPDGRAGPAVNRLLDRLETAQFDALDPVKQGFEQYLHFHPRQVLAQAAAWFALGQPLLSKQSAEYVLKNL